MTNEEAISWIKQSGGTEFFETYLTPVSSTDILIRVLNNLIQASHPPTTPESEARYIKAILILKPDSGFHRLRLVQLLMGMKELGEAREQVEYLIEHHSDEFNEARLQALLDSINP